MDVDPAALWNAWLTDRDEAAFETLVRPELPATYHLARRMGLVDADAQDVVQDVLSELAQTRSTRPGQVGVGAWLMRAVRLRSLMSRRGERRRKRREQRRATQVAPPHETPAHFDVEEEVERALALLNEDDRQILVLRFLYDLDYREIAYVLGVSEGACRIRVHRASERMRSRLGTKAPTLLAALPLPGLPDAAHAIAAAAKSAVGTTLGVSTLGGLVVSTGIKMAVSAGVAALLTAGAFLALRQDPASDPGAPLLKTDGTSVQDEASGTRASVPLLTSSPALKGRVGFGGRGVIRGRVTTADGAGVSGVIIIGAPRGFNRSRGSPGEPPPAADLETEIRMAVEDAHRRVTGTRRALTDAGGGYKLTGLGNATHTVSAFARGHQIRVAQGHSARDAKDGSTVDFLATPIANVTVSVMGIDRSSTGRVGLLRARSREGLTRAGLNPWQPDRPVLSLQPGTWWVQAVQGQDRELVSEPQQITLTAGGEVPTLTFALAGSPGLRGRVEIVGGLKARTVEVYAMHVGDAALPESWEPRRSDGVLRGRYDQRDGTFTIPGIGAGRYLLGAVIGGRDAAGLMIVQIEDRMVEAVIQVDVSGSSRYVVVFIMGPDGEPAATDKINISASYRADKVGIAGGGHALRRPDGAWLVAQNPMAPPPVDAEGKRADGVYALQITYRGVGERNISYDPTSREELHVRFSEPATLEITVAGLRGSSLAEGLQLHLMPELAADRMSLSGVRATRAGDVFTFTNVQPGPRRVGMVFVDSASGLSGMRFMILDVRLFEVRSGKNADSWRLPARHSLRVECPVGTKYIRFGLVRLDDAGNWMQQFASSAEENAPAIFENVAPGRYELVGRVGDEEKRISVHIPGDKIVRLD